MEIIIFKSSGEKSTISDLSWQEKWQGDDNGLIACWEQGKKLALTNELLVNKVKNNELPILPWKGGYEAAIKKTIWHLPYYYFAMWQGLRGDDLNINLSENVKITCTKTGMTSIFTNDESLFDRK